MGISVVLIAQNSEKSLDECLQSVQGLAREIVLVDGNSTDRTEEIARKFGAQVFRKELKGFGEQKQFALDHAKEEWAFILDSDETVSPGLAEEIKRLMEQQPAADAFSVPRRNYYFGQWLRHGGKYPDRQVRLIRRAKVRFSDDVVHEKLMVNGQVGRLENWIDHYSYPDLFTWFRKLELFAEFRGLELARKNVRPSVFNALKFCFFRPGWRFARKYIFKLGFLDGRRGFLACVHDALTEILSYFKLLEKTER